MVIKNKLNMHNCSGGRHILVPCAGAAARRQALHKGAPDAFLFLVSDVTECTSLNRIVVRWIDSFALLYHSQLLKRNQ